MAEETAETAADETSEQTEVQPETGQQDKQQGSEHRAILADLARERRERKRLAQELETEKAKYLSDAEKAVADAKAAGRTEATLEAGKRLARAEIRAAAAAKQLDVKEILEDLDLSRFVGDDGEPDEKAITKAIDRWAGLARPRGGDLGQGYRGNTAPSTDMNQIIRNMVAR